MAFCGICGNQLNPGSKFCPKCGAQASSENSPALTQTSTATPTNYVQQSQDIRQQSMVELNRMYNYFGQKSVLYNEYDSLNTKLDSLEKGYFSSKSTLGIIAIVLGALALVFNLFLLFACLQQASEQKRHVTSGDWILLIVGIFISVGLLIAGPLLLASYKRGKKKHDNTIIQSLCRLNEVANELNNHYIAYGPCLVGREYSNPQIIGSIAQMIQSGRADTPKEAINRMLEDAHRSFMQLQMEITARSARQAAASAHVAAGAAIVGAAASFCSPNFFIVL